MGYNDYDRAPAAFEAGRPAASVQAGFINRVFGWMTVGLAVTGVVAALVASNRDMLVRTQQMFLLFVILEFVVVIGLSAAINRISAAAATAGFLFFAVLNGATLSWIFLAYEPQSIAATFFATSGTFGAMGLIGWITRRDLSGLGGLCFMGLIGVIIASVVNMFWFNSTVSLVISILGVLIFVGLTAYDVQKIKQMAIAVEDGEIEAEAGRKFAILGALTLYLDFINLFLMLLRLFGNRR